MLKRVLIGFLVLVAFVPVGRADTNGPAAVVDAFHVTLLSVMKDAEALGFKGRYARIEPAMNTAYDLPRMTRIATGSHWKKATAEQQAGLVAAFTRMSVGTYASRFDGYEGEKFETLGTRAGPQKTTLVSTRIIDSDGKPIGLTYVTLETGGTWKIVDVLLDNSISELAVRISEYRQVLNTGGVDALIASLNEKADVLAK